MNIPKSLTSVTPFSKALALILFIFLPILTFYLGLRYQSPTEYPSLIPKILPTHPVEKACTLEARICPDGSSVGRTGPNCEFAACPTSQAKTKLSEICRQYGGTWLEKQRECESASAGLNEATCKRYGGMFHECESACRHDPRAQACIEVCIQVCKF